MEDTNSPQNTAENAETNPPTISFTTFLLKLLAGGAGGILGTLVLLLIILLAQSTLPSAEQILEENYVSPIIVFISSVMVFLASTIGNILSVFLLSLTEREKYHRRSSTITQVFVVSVIIFLLMVPVYFITSSLGASVTAYTIAIHILVTAQVSALILEIVSNYRYALVGVYGVTFSILMSAGIMFSLANVIESPTLLLFAMLPVAWGSIAFVQSIVTMIYAWIARIYDKDFLCTQTVYGADYGKEVESEEETAPTAQDKEGADFMRDRDEEDDDEDDDDEDQD